MRKFLISVAALASVIGLGAVTAAPASAIWDWKGDTGHHKIPCDKAAKMC